MALYKFYYIVLYCNTAKFFFGFLKKILESDMQTYTIMDKLRNLDRRLGVTIHVYQKATEMKLNLFGHVCGTNNQRLIKTGGVTEAPNKPGRPRRECLDDVKRMGH